MAKGILEFQLPEEREDFEMAQNGVLYSIILDELDNWLRAKYKYENQENITIKEVRQKIGLLKDERNIK